MTATHVEVLEAAVWALFATHPSPYYLRSEFAVQIEGLRERWRAAAIGESEAKSALALVDQLLATAR